MILSGCVLLLLLHCLVQGAKQSLDEEPDEHDDDDDETSEPLTFKDALQVTARQVTNLLYTLGVFLQVI
jgi:hypothetical protein